MAGAVAGAESPEFSASTFEKVLLYAVASHVPVLCYWALQSAVLRRER